MVSQPVPWAGRVGGFALRTFHPDRFGTARLHRPGVQPCPRTDGARDDWKWLIGTNGIRALILPCGTQQKRSPERWKLFGKVAKPLSPCSPKTRGYQPVQNQTPASGSVCSPRIGDDQLLGVVNTQSYHNEKALQAAAAPVPMPSCLSSGFLQPDRAALGPASRCGMPPCPKAAVAVQRLCYNPRLWLFCMKQRALNTP